MNIAECILYLNPQAKFVCWNNDYKRIVWNKSHTGIKPTLAELEAVWPTVEALIADREAKPARILAEIVDNLPTWSAINDQIDGITTLAQAKKALKKIARVVYLLAKNSET